MITAIAARHVPIIWKLLSSDCRTSYWSTSVTSSDHMETELGHGSTSSVAIDQMGTRVIDQISKKVIQNRKMKLTSSLHF